MKNTKTISHFACQILNNFTVTLVDHNNSDNETYDYEFGVTGIASDLFEYLNHTDFATQNKFITIDTILVVISCVAKDARYRLEPDEIKLELYDLILEFIETLL